jgi:hypothetical protein
VIAEKVLPLKPKSNFARIKWEEDMMKRKMGYAHACDAHGGDKSGVGR